jgi:hypothetical protein
LIGVATLLVWVSVTLAGTVSDEARRYMARGIAAVEMAKSPGDYALAVKEFEQAARLAPDWPEIYYNLGSVQSKAGDYTSAMKSFQRYLDLAPQSPDAAKVQEDIFKLEYRQERIKKVAELAGVWLVGKTPFAISINDSEFIAKGSVGTDGVTVISDGGVLVGKQGRTPRGNSEMIFKGRIDGFSIKGMRHRGPFTEGVSGCTIPVDQSEFTGAVSEDGNRITLNFQKGMYQADRDAGLFFGLDSCTGVKKTGEMPETYVLTRQGGVQGKSDPAGSSGMKLKKGVGFVGMNISEADPQLIADVVQGMPAAEGGIKIGDRILRVDGKEAKGLTSQQLVERIRGQAGSRVTVEVERQGETKPLSFTLVRKAH